MELAVFLRGDLDGGGERLDSLSLPELFRESQEKGLVSLRVGAPEAEAGGGGWTTGTGGSVDSEVDVTAGGDHGMAGSELAMLLNDSVRGGSLPSAGLSFGSRHSGR